jgi:hypothetical protein
VTGELRAHGLDADTAITGEATEGFWALVGSLESLVRERAAAAREDTIAYLRQERMLDPGRWALVDLGWRLTAQTALRHILREAGAPEEVLGYYFAINSRRTRLADSGPFRAFLLEEDDPRADELLDDWVYCHQDVIEQVFAMADHGSCTGYRRGSDGTMEAVVREPSPDPRRDAFAAALQDTTVECARELARTGLLAGNLDDVRTAGLVAGRMAVARPTRDEAAGIAWLQVADDQNETRMRPLAEPLGLEQLVGRRPDGRDGETESFEADTFWPEGAMALTPPATRSAARAARAVRDGAEWIRQRRPRPPVG